MKKQLLLAAFLMGGFFTATAQEEIFNVDFSTLEVLEDWSLINADGDTFNWTVDTEGFEQLTTNGFTGGVALSASFDNTAGPLTPDNSLITQAFTVPAGGATLTYKIGAVDPEWFEEHYAVYIIDAAAYDEILAGLQADPQTATIEDYLALLETAVVEETLTTEMATTKTVAIEGMDGESVRVVFRHYDITDVFMIALDDIVVTEGATTGTEEFAASTLSVFPNPATNVINVANNEVLNNVQIVDLNGRTVKSVQVNANEAQINISDLAAGVYMMNIATDKGTTTKKIVKN